MKKQPEITEATRRRFVEVFCDLYWKKPIEKITVKEIAEAAGYNRVTFYEYFQDVFDLRDQVEHSIMEEILTTIRENAPRTLHGDFFIPTAIEMMAKNREKVRLLLCNPHNHHFAQTLSQNLVPQLCRSFGITEENTRAWYAFEFYVPGVVALIAKSLETEVLTEEELACLIQGILNEGILAQLHRS